MENKKFEQLLSIKEGGKPLVDAELKTISFPKTIVSPFIFRGVHENERVVVERLYFDFPLEQIKNHPELFYDAAKNIYLQEKLLNPINGDNPREIDMSKIEDLSLFESHLKVHAITGLPELGTSDTVSIPYWDRQGVMSGLTAQFDPDQAQFFQEESDVESINIIRAFLALYIPKYNYARLAVSNLDAQISRGQVTIRDIGPLFEAQRNVWSSTRDTYRHVIIAKVKHLFYCLDKIRDQKIRTHCLEEVLTELKDTDIENKELEINLGIDGGVTANSYRPGYHITLLKQLNHYDKEDIILSADESFNWTFEEVLSSLERPTDAKSSLQEPPSYLLDWRFSLMSPKEHQKIKESVGTMTESTLVTGGLIHEVTRLSNGTDYFFLKKRSPSLVKVEGIAVDKKDVAYEYSALKFFNEAFPDIIPKPLMFDTDQGLLLMTDALVGGQQLIEKLAEDNPEDIPHITKQIGTALGKIHGYSKGKTVQVEFNPNNDFSEILNFRYMYQNIDALSKVVEKIRNKKEHVLLGGLSPKNILTNSDEVAFVDLETACAGDPVFDYAFCIGHILLHHIKNPKLGISLFEAFESSYHTSYDLEFDPSEVATLILGTFLYRLDNGRVPYSLKNIDTTERQYIIEEIKLRLAKKDIAISDIFQFI